MSTKFVGAEPIVKITNYSSNSSPEWVELQNQTSNPIDLSLWSIGDGNTQVVYDLPLTGCLSPNSYQTFFHDSGWLNDSGDTINLFNQNTLIDSLVYTSGKLDLSYRSTNTCTPTTTPAPSPTNSPVPTSTTVPLPTITPSPVPPTNTVAPTPTSVPTNTITPTKIPTPTITKTPTSSPEPTSTPSSAPSIEPTPYFSPFPTNSEPTQILGESQSVVAVSKDNTLQKLIPLMFICVGGLLLVTPIIVSKIRSVKK